MPTKNSSLCSDHFSDNDFKEGPSAHKILKTGVLPSIFKFPDQVTKENNFSPNRKKTAICKPSLLNKITMASTKLDVTNMVCAVPECGTSVSNIRDPSITFHKFPGDPKMAVNWINQINFAAIPKGKPLWFPSGNSMICSQHFLQTDFEDNGVLLKPRAVPKLFKYQWIALSKIGSGNRESSTEATKSPADQTSTESDTITSGSVVKPSTIKDILHRASSLFAKNMAFNNKLVSDTGSVSPSPTNENECSEYVTPGPSYSNELPELNIDKALSEAKRQLHEEKLKRTKKNLSRPSKTFLCMPSESSVVRSPKSGSCVDRLPINTVRNKPSVIPKMSLEKGNMIQKIKQESNSSYELIKIGPNKFLKIQRLDTSNPLSINAALNTTTEKKSSNQQAEDDDSDEVMDCGGDDVSQSSDDHNSSTAHKTDKISTVKGISNTVKSFPIKTPETDKNCSATVMSDTPDKIPVYLFSDTNMPLTRSPDYKFKSSSKPQPTFMQNISLHSENANLKNKVAELEKKCLDQQKYSSDFFFKENALLKKKIEQLEKECPTKQKPDPLIERLKVIREGANKGDGSATFILEQISGYGKAKCHPRFSNTTMIRCAQLCRKGAYAYELFRKADFVRLPTFSTVEKFMRKNPKLCLPSDSPSDKNKSSAEVAGSSSTYRDVSSEPNGLVRSQEEKRNRTVPTIPKKSPNKATKNLSNVLHIEPTETTTIPVTIDTSNSELQEVILASGEVVQCYSTSICTGPDGYQYYIFPNEEENTEGNHENTEGVHENTGGDHEHSVVESVDSENAQVPQQQKQIVYISNPNDPLQCYETEVSTAIDAITEL